MKSFLFMLIVAWTVSTPEWLTDFDHAKELAKQDDKMILLNFSGSDWCAPCIQMKKTVFETPPFQDFASDKLILVRADFPRHKKNQLTAEQKARNEKLAALYNSKGKFPLTLLLDSSGQVIAAWDGYSGAKAEEFVREVKAKLDGK